MAVDRGRVRAVRVGSAPPSRESLTQKFEGRVVAMDEAVKVPAGTFRAARIEITHSSQYFGKFKEVLWLAKGTGLVKRVEENLGNQRKYTTELVAFTAGNPRAGDPAVAVKQVLAPIIKKNGKPDVVAMVKNRALEDGVASTFHIARWKGRFPAVIRY